MANQKGDTRNNDSPRPFLRLLVQRITDVAEAKSVGEDWEVLVEKLQCGGSGDGC